MRWERTTIPSEDEPDRDFDRVVGPLSSLLTAAEVRDFSPGWDGPDDDQEREWDLVLLLPPAAGELDFSAAWDEPEDDPDLDFDLVMGPLAARTFLWKIIKIFISYSK